MLIERPRLSEYLRDEVCPVMKVGLFGGEPGRGERDLMVEKTHRSQLNLVFFLPSLVQDELVSSESVY